MIEIQQVIMYCPQGDPTRKWIVNNILGHAYLKCFELGIVDSSSATSGVDIQKAKDGPKWIISKILFYGSFGTEEEKTIYLNEIKSLIKNGIERNNISPESLDFEFVHKETFDEFLLEKLIENSFSKSNEPKRVCPNCERQVKKDGSQFFCSNCMEFWEQDDLLLKN